jgi:acetyl esterase/lipase
MMKKIAFVVPSGVAPLAPSHARKRATRLAMMPAVLGLLAATAGGCTTETAPADDGEALQAAAEASAGLTATLVGAVTREQVADDVYHYSFLLKVGNTPNARIRVHRVVREDAPKVPHPTSQAILLMHGDFATFTTNFLPSRISPTPKPHDLAVYLAQRGIDVWGVDRRWTTAPAEGTDFSDFAGMGVAQAISDTGLALSFARASRVLSGGSQDRMFLGGFSSGAQLTYLYAAEESQKPFSQRQVKGIVPIDIYAKLSPADESLRLYACANAADEYDSVAQGYVDSDNSKFAQPLGALAASDPGGDSLIFPGYTNREAMLGFVSATFLLYEPKPQYHLVAGMYKNGFPTQLRYASEALIDDWLAHAPPHESLVETADRDAMWCGTGTLPLADHLADINVPLFYLGAAGGFGDHGIYTTTLVASTDVTTHVVRRLPASREVEDYGHADLLYADDAPALAWAPLAQWLLAH